ncbi:oligoribonuclease [Aspergillus lucknowensis]|uniref:Ribonuclease H-like domain-containing protein n=1 Tax=Aspergillus lucknowensis TaxID=176173 RepID=A0ABR4LRD0_9EURO
MMLCLNNIRRRKAFNSDSLGLLLPLTSPSYSRFIDFSTMPLTRSSDPLVWIDCEMTGLDPKTDQILQICCFITDAQLNLLDTTGFETVIHQPKSTLDAMSQWCIDTHGRTGLTARVQNSTVTPETAAAELLAYVKRYIPNPRTAMLAGNSVHADKAFLACGPYATVLDWLHYRIVDVSTMKEVVRRWGGENVLAAAPGKREVHLARDDILESIEEMKFYKQTLFS